MDHGSSPFIVELWKMRTRKEGGKEIKMYASRRRIHGRCTSARDLLTLGGGAGRATLQKEV
jgi:hypothetical protein